MELVIPSVEHPITCHEGSEEKQRYSFTLSLTSALEMGGWSTPCPGRLTHYQYCQRALFETDYHVLYLTTDFMKVVLYGCKTWSLTLREGRRLRVFENRALRRIFRPRKNEVTGSGENYIRRGLMICTAHQILFE